jgi:hypothetical protein
MRPVRYFLSAFLSASILFNKNIKLHHKKSDVNFIYSKVIKCNLKLCLVICITDTLRLIWSCETNDLWMQRII